MIFAKLGAMFAAPFFAFSTFFGMHHEPMMNASSSAWIHASTTIPSWHATSTSDKDKNNNWNNGWDGSKDKDKDHTTHATTTAAVHISSIDPTQGAVGTAVTLTGTGFTSDATIHFGGGAVKNATTSSDGTHIQFTIPESVGPYCKPHTACPMYLMLVRAGDYKVWVEDKNGVSNTLTFTVTAPSTTPITPALSISGIDAPATLALGTSGTWTVHVDSTGLNGNLHYSVKWGDENTGLMAMFRAPDTETSTTSATFTHTYESTGTFTPTFTVTDDSDHSVTTSATVRVTPLY